MGRAKSKASRVLLPLLADEFVEVKFPQNFEVFGTVARKQKGL
jgi:hypothetical protein